MGRRLTIIKRDGHPLGDRPYVVTLCGSTKFKEEFIAAQKRFTLEGYIVLTVGFFQHTEARETQAQLERSGANLGYIEREHPIHGDKELALGVEKAAALDELHKRKIDLSDEVFVINVGGYIGDSTRGEIEYAERLGVPVHYFEEISTPRPRKEHEPMAFSHSDYDEPYVPVEQFARDHVEHWAGIANEAEADRDEWRTRALAAEAEVERLRAAVDAFWKELDGGWPQSAYSIVASSAAASHLRSAVDRG